MGVQVNELPSQMLCLALSIITIATSRHYVQLEYYVEIRLQKVRQALIAVLTGVDPRHGKTYRKGPTRMAVKETFYLSSEQVSEVPSCP